MPKAVYPKVVTANHLLEGDVVYLAPGNVWTRDHSQAELFLNDKDAETALAQAAKQTGTIVGAYLADARKGPDGKPEPVHFREVFRTKGPSNYPNHGKQAEG